MLELESVPLLSAFIAGVFMFLAPCTLPLLPAYIGYISGVTEKEIRNKETQKSVRLHIFKHSVLFVTGFSIVLVFSGLTAGFLGGLIPHVVSRGVEVIGGIILLLLGLFMMGVLKSSFLSKERRFMLPKWFTVGTPISSLLLGVTFAVGWTPCLGPVFGLILFYAGNVGTALTGAILLLIFALGFSVPFLLFGLLISQATWLLEKALPYLHFVSILGGFVLALIGLTFLFGDTFVTNWFFQLFNFLDFEESLLRYL